MLGLTACLGRVTEPTPGELPAAAELILLTRRLALLLLPRKSGKLTPESRRNDVACLCFVSY